MEDRTRICPVERAGSLDNKWRKWLQDPQKILAPFVSKGMTVLDVGCGPGFFSIEIAKLVGPEGKVYSADIQEGMLQKIRGKIQGTELEKIITTIKCNEKGFSVPTKVDFILAFYMVHEVPDKATFFRQCKNALADGGQFLLIEPTMFHVSKSEFAATLEMARQAGFQTGPGPKLPLSHSALLKK